MTARRVDAFPAKTRPVGSIGAIPVPNSLARKAAQQERQRVGGMPHFLSLVHIADAALLLRPVLGAFSNRDETGYEIDSLHVAEIEAMRTAGELTRDRLLQAQGASSEDIRVEVKDEQRQPILTVTVSIQVGHEALMPSLRM